MVADRSVRPALPGDAAAIARVQQAAVRADHPDLPEELLEALAGPAAEAAWRAAVESPPSRQHLLLTALEGQRVVGFAALGPGADADLDAASRELLELRVEPSEARAGHGSRLLAASVDVLAPDAVELLVSWVAFGSPIEQLLRSSGWAPDGSTRELEVIRERVAQQRWTTRLRD